MAGGRQETCGRDESAIRLSWSDNQTGQGAPPPSNR